MPGDPPRIYWDACVFLSYINKTPDRLPHIKWYLDRSGKDFQIVTSILSVAEVIFAEREKQQGTLDADIAAKIDALWLSDDTPVRLSEVYLDLVLEARDLSRAALVQKPQGWTIKPSDAIHMATAKRLSVTEIHTYSKDWPRNAALLGIKIGEPVVTAGPLFEQPVPPAAPAPAPAVTVVPAPPLQAEPAKASAPTPTTATPPPAPPRP
jgi:predicted nucleic acid-binding protein